MNQEKFAGGYPKGVESLMVGEVGYREAFEDVRPQLEAMDETQRKSLILLVACDRIWGFFEERGGTANGPRLVKLVRGLARELGLLNGLPRRNSSRYTEDPRLRRDNDEIDVSKEEARAYYDELVKMGVIEFVGELGAKNVFLSFLGDIY